MRLDDIEEVMGIASVLPEASQWPRVTYEKALEPQGTPERIALVFEDGLGAVRGYLITVLIPPEAELETIAVAPADQRRGIGATLLGELFDLLKKRQITEIILEVRESNVAARAFYRSTGWIETGRRAGYYPHPKEDAILLGCSIT
jgi:ribosomal-protein-alanine N-acetyltransferase